MERIKVSLVVNVCPAALPRTTAMTPCDREVSTPTVSGSHGVAAPFVKQSITHTIARAGARAIAFGPREYAKPRDIGTPPALPQLLSGARVPNGMN